MSFQRLLKDYLINDIDDIFFNLCENIGNLMHINRSVQYIDGTKFEANANKYTFVYKTRIVNARRKMVSKITESIIALNNEKGFNFTYRYFYCAQEIGYIAQYLMESMVYQDITLAYGKGKRKSNIQRWYDIFLEYYTKLDEYEHWLDIIGEERNSYSKTDYDATMCATKIDYYLNTGLRESEFIGGDIDLRINIYRGQLKDYDLNNDLDDLNQKLDSQQIKLLNIISKDSSLAFKEYGAKLNTSEATVKRLFNKLKKSKGVKREGSTRIGRWIINE